MPISKKILAWRRKQKRGSIMEPETFEDIKQKAARSGKYGDPEAVAGAAYWRTVREKYLKRRRRKG